MGRGGGPWEEGKGTVKTNGVVSPPAVIKCSATTLAEGSQQTT